MSPVSRRKRQPSCIAPTFSRPPEAHAHFVGFVQALALYRVPSNGLSADTGCTVRRGHWSGVPGAGYREIDRKQWLSF
jgi:hypothetical protein